AALDDDSRDGTDLVGGTLQTGESFITQIGEVAAANFSSQSSGSQGVAELGKHPSSLGSRREAGATVLCRCPPAYSPGAAVRPGLNHRSRMRKRPAQTIPNPSTWTENTATPLTPCD